MTMKGSLQGEGERKPPALLPYLLMYRNTMDTQKRTQVPCVVLQNPVENQSHFQAEMYGLLLAPSDLFHKQSLPC